MKNILNQLEIDYISEYSPEWIKPKRYDFYIPKLNVIIEMDGAFHYIERQKSNLTLDEVKNMDNYKESIALQHGIKVIRIDCNYYGLSKRQSYISNNILTSELSQLINLNDIDFDEANIYASAPSFKRICELWDNGNHDLNDIALQLDIDYSTVSRCLKYGEEIGICQYVFEEQKEKHRKISAKIGEDSGQPVLCNETNEIFSSIAKASRFYNCNLYKYFYKEQEYCGTTSDGTRLTWIKLSKQQYEDIKSRAS